MRTKIKLLSKNIKFIIILLFPILFSMIIYFNFSYISEKLSFLIDNENIWYIYVSSYIHGSKNHLFGNVLGYILVLIPYYYFCMQNNDIAYFFKSMLLIFLILPIIHMIGWGYISKNILNKNLGAVGLSTTIAALVGLLLHSIVLHINNEFIKSLNKNNMYMSLYGITGLIIVFQYIKYEIINYLMILFIVIFIIISGYKEYIKIIQHIREINNKKDYAKLLMVCYALIIYYINVYSLFPSNLIVEGSVINIISHFIGLMFGLFLPIILYRWI